MIPDDTVDRYYYIFDGREQRALVMDRMTGREYAWDDAPQAPLIDHVQTHRSSAVLRAFARWCARQTDVAAVPLHTTAGRLWAAVRRTEDANDLRRIRTDAVDAAVVAAAVGLPRRRPEAARLLAVHACTHPTPRRAALDAAHMHERWTEFEAGTSAAVQATRQQQVDWLLDALGTS
ncbi:MAG: hypothetical protein ACLFTE_02210 [Salinivenus sp.]